MPVVTLARTLPRIPAPRLRGAGRGDLVVGAASRQAMARGRVRLDLSRRRPLTFATARALHDAVPVVLCPPAGRGGCAARSVQPDDRTLRGSEGPMRLVAND